MAPRRQATFAARERRAHYLSGQRVLTAAGSLFGSRLDGPRRVSS
jgi:hypothetical protein